MKNIISIILTLSILIFMNSCSDDDPLQMRSAEYTYQFNNGQVVPTAPYAGTHNSDLDASLRLDELENGNTLITVTLTNTVNGATYRLHAHDAADPNSTPNGTPYSESPNTNIFVQTLQGTGGSASVSQEAEMTFEALTNQYEGFFVVHDPLQQINVVDISTYLIVGTFARTQPTTQFRTAVFEYDFNIGQLASSFAYDGSHPSDLSTIVQIDELSNNQSRVSVSIMNSLDGEVYRAHAHDMADATTTPNGTPYMESPNTNVLVTSIVGNGETARNTFIASMEYDEIVNTYDGFFVIHDPLQPITTVDPTTYVVLGVFARNN